jgi:branched-chain amino acid aminotransferase
MTKSLSLESSICLLRDQFVPFSDANVSIASSPVLYGLCVYTVFSANWNEQKQQLFVFRLKDHYERLLRSCRVMGFSDISEQYSYEQFKTRMLELINKNDVKEDALVRVMVFIDEISAGTKIDGLKVALTAYIYPMGEILNVDGIHACVSSWTRNADNMIPPRAKLNGGYINASLMKNEALLNGYDEAIALDAHGHVAEGTVANLFLVRGGKLLTPHAQADILEGITRNSILKIAEKLHILVEEREVDRTELYIADEMMLVGSSARITPVLSVDKRKIGDGNVGEITRKLSQAYRAAQYGEDETYTDWLIPIY